MKHWIAYEHDDTGWPTEAFLIVLAETQQQARSAMAAAITARRDAEQSLTLRARISEIFIEAPTELAADDPRANLAPGGNEPMFEGFDNPERPPSKPPAPGRLR